MWFAGQPEARVHVFVAACLDVNDDPQTPTRLVNACALGRIGVRITAGGMRCAKLVWSLGFASLAATDAAEGDGFRRYSKLEEVRYETMLMEKKLEYAKLELEELRIRHERDMRATAVRLPAVIPSA